MAVLLPQHLTESGGPFTIVTNDEIGALGGGRPIVADHPSRRSLVVSQ
jgi:hypothetical protein